MTDTEKLIRLAVRADEAGAGGARRDALEALVLHSASWLIDESYEAGNRREDTASELIDGIRALVEAKKILQAAG